MLAKTYLTDLAAPFTPTNNRGAWNHAAQAVTRKLGIEKTDATLTAGQADDDDSNTEWDLLVYRGVSDALAAQTISGTLSGVLIAAAGLFPDHAMYWHVHLYATVGDSDTVRCTLVNDYRENAPSSAFPHPGLWGGFTLSAIPITSGAILAGDRLVLEIGGVARNNFDATFEYWVSVQRGAKVDAIDAAPGLPIATPQNSWINFSVPVLELGETSTTGTTKRNAWRGDEPLVAWVEFFHKDSVGAAYTYRWSELPVTNNTTYLEPRSMAFGIAERALSDRQGRLEGAQFGFTVADTDNAIKTFLGNPATIALRHVEVVVKVQSIREFRAGVLEPLVVWRGLVKTYSHKDFKFSFVCQDWLSARIGTPVPLRRVGTDFAGQPGLPTTSRDRLGPIPYGLKSDEASATAPPDPQDEAARGVDAIAGDVGIAGHGDLPGVPATAAGLVEDVGAGTIDAGVVLVGFVTAFHGTVETNPEPFLETALTITTGAGSAAATLSWTPAVGAAKYRAYIGFRNAGATIWSHYLETVGTSVQFTAIHPLGVDPTAANITPGGVPIYNPATYWWAWSAVMPDGETALSREFQAAIVPYARPKRTVVDPVAGAAYYWVYKRTLPGTYFARIRVEVTALNGAGDVFLDDDLSGSSWEEVSGGPTPMGANPTIYAGTFTDLEGFQFWEGFAVAGCAIAGIDQVYQQDAAGVWQPLIPSHVNTTLAVHGFGIYASLFGSSPFRVQNGHRWTMIYFRDGQNAEDAKSGTRPLRVNLRGVETVGDSTGTLIESIYEQRAHFLDNFVLPDAPDPGAGDWVTTIQTWADGTPRRNVASYATAAAAAAIAIPAGPAGAWSVMEPITMLEVLAFLAVSGDIAYGSTREGEEMIVMENDQSPAIDTLTEAHDIAEGSFAWEDLTDPSWHWNQAAYQYDGVHDHGGALTYAGAGVVDEPVSQLRFRPVPLRNPETITLRGRAHAAAAGQILDRMARRSGHPPREAVAQSGLSFAIDVDLGDVLAITHIEGPQSGGWVSEPAQVRRIAPNIGNFLTNLTLRQVVALPTSSGEEEMMAEFDLGGSRYHAPTLADASPQTVYPYDHRFRKLQWSLIPLTATVTAVCYGQVDAGLSLVLRVWNETDGAQAGVDAAAITQQTLQLRPIPIPRPGDGLAKEYSLKCVVTGGDSADEIQVIGSIRVEP